jgi:hypothetical protein
MARLLLLSARTVRPLANPARPVKSAAWAVKSAAEDMSQVVRPNNFSAHPDRSSLSGFYSVLV